MEHNSHLDNPVARSLLDAFPAPVFITDSDLSILDMNQDAVALIGDNQPVHGEQLCGNVLHCVHVINDGGICGTMPPCATCPIRQAVKTAHDGTRVCRRWCRMNLALDNTPAEACFLVPVSPFELGGASRFLVVLEDVTDIAELRRFLPTCSHCGKVRPDTQYWQSLEDYVRQHTQVELSHGLCPGCLEQLYGDEGRQIAAQMLTEDSQTATSS